MYWLTGLLGIAAISAPFLLGYSNDTAALWTSVIIGFTLVGASVFEWAADGEQKWEYWVAGVAGLVAVLAPFLLGAGMNLFTWTLMAIGFMTMAVAGMKLYPGRSGTY